MKQFVKSFLKGQWTSNSSAMPTQRYDKYNRTFYLDSPAGTVKWRLRGSKDISIENFRNTYVNAIEELGRRRAKGEDVTKESFKIYRDLKKEYRVSYRANFRTRLVGLREWISFKLQLKIS